MGATDCLFKAKEAFPVRFVTSILEHMLRGDPIVDMNVYLHSNTDTDNNCNSRSTSRHLARLFQV